MTMKQVRFVKADSRHPVQDIAELAVFDASGNPADPPTSLADGSVTNAKLADNAVNSGKIQEGGILGVDIAKGAITADKIASGVLPTNATKEKAGLVKQAAHVDPAKGLVADVVNALIGAGLMASA